jgi:hypothetical protein
MKNVSVLAYLRIKGLCYPRAGLETMKNISVLAYLRIKGLCYHRADLETMKNISVLAYLRIKGLCYPRAGLETIKNVSVLAGNQSLIHSIFTILTELHWLLTLSIKKYRNQCNVFKKRHYILAYVCHMF